MGHNKDVVFAWESVCDVSHQIREKVHDAIYVWAPFNFVDAFYSYEGPFGPRADDIYTIRCRLLQWSLVYGCACARGMRN